MQELSPVTLHTAKATKYFFMIDRVYRVKYTIPFTGDRVIYIDAGYLTNLR
jgi:hypothetical protein